MCCSEKTETGSSHLANFPQLVTLLTLWEGKEKGEGTRLSDGYPFMYVVRRLLSKTTLAEGLKMYSFPTYIQCINTCTVISCLNNRDLLLFSVAEFQVSGDSFFKKSSRSFSLSTSLFFSLPLPLVSYNGYFCLWIDLFHCLYFVKYHHLRNFVSKYDRNVINTHTIHLA